MTMWWYKSNKGASTDSLAELHSSSSKLHHSASSNSHGNQSDKGQGEDSVGSRVFMDCSNRQTLKVQSFPVTCTTPDFSIPTSWKEAQDIWRNFVSVR